MTSDAIWRALIQLIDWHLTRDIVNSGARLSPSINLLLLHICLVDKTRKVLCLFARRINTSSSYIAKYLLDNISSCLRSCGGDARVKTFSLNRFYVSARKFKEFPQIKIPFRLVLRHKRIHFDYGSPYFPTLNESNCALDLVCGWSQPGARRWRRSESYLARRNYIALCIYRSLALYETKNWNLFLLCVYK